MYDVTVPWNSDMYDVTVHGTVTCMMSLSMEQ